MKLLLHAALLLLIAATPLHVGAQNLGKQFPFLKKMGIRLTPHHVLGAHIECPYFDDNLKEDELPISLENKQREALLRGVLPTYEDEIDRKTVEIVGMDMGIWLAGVKALPGGNTLVLFTYEYGDGGASAIGIYNAKGVRTDYLGMGPNEGTEYYDIDEEHTHIRTHHRTVLDFTGERSMALSYKMMRERTFTTADGTINEYGVANYKETGKQVDWTMSERYDYDINDAGHIVLRALPKPQCDGPVDANILLRDPINALYYYAASDAQRLERFNELAGRPEYNVEPEDKDFLNEWHYHLRDAMSDFYTSNAVQVLQFVATHRTSDNYVREYLYELVAESLLDKADLIDDINRVPDAAQRDYLHTLTAQWGPKDAVG